MKTFYIYQLRAENSILPFYIGKGEGNRLKHHFYPNNLKPNTYKNNKIKNYQSKGIKVLSEILYTSTCEASCFEMEIELIKLYGRLNTKTGILTNITEGGRGIAGNKASDTTKEKMRGNQNSSKYTPQQINDYIEEWKQSNTGPIIFCELNSINYNTFMTWLRNNKLFSRKYTLEYKREHIYKLKQSGMTKREYCMVNNIPERCIYQWIKFLKDK